MADNGRLDDRYKIAYDSSASLIAGQRSIVDNLRQRATVLVTAVTISVSLSVSVGLLGTGAKPLPGWALAFLLALVVLVGGCSFYILLPRAWIFGHSGSAIIQEHIEGDDPSSINDMYRDMTIYLDRYFDDNERQLGRLFKAFQVGVLGLAAEVVVLIVGFSTR